jgi:dipeptidyl aminopeptidase/acylaminoacyl peptidase
LLSLDWTSDIASAFRTYLGKSHLDAPELYQAMSPISYVRDIATPLLIVHSEDDLRCPIEQAEQMFVALRILQRDVEFVRFPAESHELSRSGSPAHRRQRADIILEFFDRHLKPEKLADNPATGSPPAGM